MAELAIVRSLEGPLLVEAVIGDLRRSIIAGTIPPEYPLSLKEIASLRRVRLGMLIELARNLVRDGLITLHGDTAIVSPLDPQELEHSFRMRGIISSDLLARSAIVASPDHLRSLESILSPDRIARLETYQEARKIYFDYLMKLLRPAATESELRIVRDLWERGHRYETYGYGACDDNADPSFHSSRAAGQFMAEQLLEIGEIYRAKKLTALTQASHRLVTRGHKFAEQSLDTEPETNLLRGPWPA